MRIWKNNKWNELILDDTFPVSGDVFWDAKDKKLYSGKPDGKNRLYNPVFVSSKERGEFWMMLLEKCYARWYGSFDAIEGGHVHNALCDFVPRSVGEMISMTDDKVKADIRSGALWEKLKSYVQLGYLLGAGSPSGSDSDVSGQGIVQGHAYSLLDAREESDARGSHKLVQLRNPWGSTEWKGEWSDSDKTSWTRRMQNALGYTPDGGGDDQDGTFWMPFSSFTTYFEDIYVCRRFKTVEEGGPWYMYTAEGEWKGKTAGGCGNNAEKSQWNPQYYISVSKPTNLFVTLELKEAFGADDKDECIGFGVFKKGGKRAKTIYSGDSVFNASFAWQRMVSAESKVTPSGQPLTMRVMTWDPGHERGFIVRVYADSPLDMVDGTTLRLIPESVPAQ